MESLERLSSELDYINMSSDIVYEKADDESSSEYNESRIKDAFYVISSHINNVLTYIQDYSDSKNQTESDYTKRIKELYRYSNRAIENHTESICVIDARPILKKYDIMSGTIFKHLEDLINSRSYKSSEDVIVKANTIEKIILEFDDSLDKDSDIEVWINPKTVSSACEEELHNTNQFYMSMKQTYMDITRLNNKVSNIASDNNMDDSIKSELISKSIKVIKEATHFYVKWNKYFLKHYPMIKS